MGILTLQRLAVTSRPTKFNIKEFQVLHNECIYGFQKPIPVAARWFEPRRWHGCLSLESVVSCQVEVSAKGPIPLPDESH